MFFLWAKLTDMLHSSEASEAEATLHSEAPSTESAMVMGLIAVRPGAANTRGLILACRHQAGSLSCSNDF